MLALLVLVLSYSLLGGGLWAWQGGRSSSIWTWDLVEGVGIGSLFAWVAISHARLPVSAFALATIAAHLSFQLGLFLSAHHLRPAADCLCSQLQEWVRPAGAIVSQTPLPAVLWLYSSGPRGPAPQKVIRLKPYYRRHLFYLLPGAAACLHGAGASSLWALGTGWPVPVPAFFGRPPLIICEPLIPLNLDAQRYA